MPKLNRVTIGLIALTSLVSLLGTGYLLAHRVADFHRENPPSTFGFIPVNDRAFKYAGRDVTITQETVPLTDIQAQGAEQAQAMFVTITYGQEVLRLRATIPGQYELPGLQQHRDWLLIARFAELTGRDIRQFDADVKAGILPDRLAIATRTPRPGSDPRTWGSVWKKDWTFDLYELLPDGTISHERLKYPTARGLTQPRPGELQENTWQFQAALQLMPQAGGVGPTRNFWGDALTAAGWTLPAAAFSGLLFTISIVFAFAPVAKGGVSFRPKTA